jgi:hypothetical protein
MSELSVCEPEIVAKVSVQNKDYYFHSNHEEGMSTEEIILHADGFFVVDHFTLFVVDHFTNPDDKSFKIFFSTIRLLKLALLVGFFC